MKAINQEALEEGLQRANWRLNLQNNDENEIKRVHYQKYHKVKAVSNGFQRNLTGELIVDAMNFFFSEEIDFSIATPLQHDKTAFITNLSERYGCNSSLSEVKSYLKNKLDECLSGSSIDSNYFSKLESCLAISYYAGDKHFRDVLEYLCYLRYYTSQIPAYSSNVQDWLAAKEYLEHLICLESQPLDFGTFFQYAQLIGKSVGYLRNKGFEINVGIGIIQMPKSENDRLIDFIQVKLKMLGFWGTRLALKEIEKFYDIPSNRYYLQYVASFSKPNQIQIPWGYIFKAGLSHYKPTPKSKNTEKQFWLTVDLIKNYLCIYQLQNLDVFEFHDRRTIMPAIRKHIMYDHIFSITQVNPKHLFKLVNGILDYFLPEHEDLSIYMHIFAKLIDEFEAGKVVTWEKKELTRYLKEKYPAAQVHIALSNIAFTPNELNHSYQYPEDTLNLNYYERPFIFNGSQYLCLNAHLFCIGFWRVLYNELIKKGIASDKIGNAAEPCLEKLFEARGVKARYGKKYKVTATQRRALHTTREEGQCDFIIETDFAIIFLELKKKAFNASSRGGDIIQASKDLSDSLFHGLSQTGWHELLLRQEGKIQFRDGEILEWKNRKIERVTISLLDFYSINDNHFVRQLLQNLIGSKIISSTHQVPDDIHKYLDQLSIQYSHPIFQEVYSNMSNPFDNCSFFSIPQLMVALENSNDNQTFYEELFSVRYMTLNGKDWYQDYYAKKGLLAQLKSEG